MFGSVDNPEVYCALYEKHHLEYKLHIDGPTVDLSIRSVTLNRPLILVTQN